ncbi:MAG: hypothetical protein CMJ34_13400 [Phycisphaerae bacterium]|nr:hypothetical protein [Phycisphaerae bacterium]
MRQTPSPHQARKLWWDAIGIALGALLCEVLAGLGDWVVTGSVGMGVPLLAMVVGITTGLSLHARRKPTWLTRASLRQLALRVAAVHAVAAAALWGASATTTGPGLAIGAVAIGLITGLSAMVVTMCTGDGVAMVFSPFAEAPSDDGPTGPWRRR